MASIFEHKPPKIREANPTKDLAFAMSLGFSVVGAVGVIVGVPLILFIFPLGFGLAGLGIALAAASMRGGTPWYAFVAVIAALIGIVGGIYAYLDYDRRVDEPIRNIGGMP